MNKNKKSSFAKTYNPTLIDPFGDNFFDLVDDDEVTCQCGTESIYGSDTNLHSTWCRKFKKFKDDK
jgi:hypothetical protein